MKVSISSWSNVLQTKTDLRVYDGESLAGKKFIARGSGRSFGDASFTSNGITLVSSSLNKIVSFDKSKGMVICQSGVLMRDLLRSLDNSGWELSVVGGTGWVTVGGGVGSDIHSKNHELVGTFGNHIRELEVILPSGLSTICSPKKNSDLFSATIGGMGLTGFIKTVTIQLRKRKGNALLLKTKKFVGIDELLRLFDNDKSEHRIGWVDFAPLVPRGIYYSAQNSNEVVPLAYKAINFTPPRIKFFYRQIVAPLNMLRYYKMKNESKISDIASFQWKTDSMKHYNYLFGRAGFHEYQFVIPIEKAEVAIYRFMETFRKHGLCPSFIVLKKFGAKKSPGLLSFPMEGFTMNPSFEADSRNKKFFLEFTEYIISIGGRFNLCKDSSLTADQFQRMYKNLDAWRKIVKKYDPKNHVQSDMSKRLKMKPW